MPATKKKRTFIGVSGLPHDLLAELREQAQRNNRSLSGELRHILQAHISVAPSGAMTNTEQAKTWNT